MANNIDVTVSNTVISVSSTQSNITVSDGNTWISNVITTQNNVSVTATPSNITVTQLASIANSTIRAALSNISPILYDNTTGVISFDANLDDLTLKKYQETVVDNGGASGNISLEITDGTVHKFITSGNITGITLANIVSGGSATIFLTQDGIGGSTLDTTTYAANWTDWEFTNGFTDLSTDPNQWNAINVLYDGTKYYATVIRETGLTIQNSDLANSNVTFNGVTVELGSSGTLDTGDIAENGNLYFTTDRANSAIGAYQGDINTAGTITAAYFSGDGGGLSNIPGHLTNAQVIAYISSNGLTVGGNILPSANSVYTLGDINNRWKDLYLSGTSIYLDDTAISAANGVLSFGGANIAVAGSSSYTTDDLPEGTGNVWFTTDRANSAIDTRVTKAFVDALGVDYNSLANTPVNVSFFTNDAGYLVAANLTSLTANVDSVNGLTGVVTLTTDEITEGSNLYFTTDRANSAIGGYQGDINTAGNITATYFSGDGGGLSNISATANLALNTTDDLAEGNTNLYFTTDRANTAIDDYVVGSENILVNSGVISLANALANVNSVQAESLNKISLGDGVGGFTFTEALGADQVATDVLNMTGGYGYTKAQPSSSFNQLTSTKLITYSGTSDVNALCFTGNVVSGSATIQLTGMEEYRYVANSTAPPQFVTKEIVGAGNIATLINEIVPGMAPMNHTRSLGGLYNNLSLGDGGTEGTQTPFPAGTYITSIDTGNLTVTMNNPAVSDFEFSSIQASFSVAGNNSFFMNTMRDTETGFLVGILSEYDVYGGARSRASVGPAKMLSTNVYAYPISGPVAGDFTYTAGSSSDYSLDMSASNFRSYSHYTQGKVSLISSENTYFGIKDGLVIGANTLTTSQMFDNGQSGFGISIGYDGITPYADDYGLIGAASSGTQNSFIPRLQLGNFTDLTRLENSLDYGATELLFRTYNGNLNEPSTGWYPRDNQELGKIGWTSYGGGSTPGAESTPSAYISVSAGEDWTDGTYGGKTNMSFVANSRFDTVNAANKSVRDVFLTYEDGGLYLGSNKTSGETRRPVIIGPVAENYQSGSGKGTRGNWSSETKRTWVEMNSANVSADSGSRLTVTNGGHNGGNAQPVVGDMVIELDRRVGSKARLPDWAWQYVASGTYGQITEDADTVVIGINYLGDQPLDDATPVYFVGTGYSFVQDLVTWTNNSNIGYLKRGRTFANQVYYGVFEDSGLTTPLTWATVTGTSWVGRGITTFAAIPFPCPLLEYDITPSHTAKKYSFELSETSDTLELKEDDVNIVSFESGNITATAFIGDGSQLTNSLVNYTTDDLTEGSTNLYYSNALVDAYINSTDFTIDANTITANAFIGGTFTGDGSDLESVRAETIEITIKNAGAVTIPAGYPVHAIGTAVGGEVEVVLADAGNAELMPAHFIANEELTSTGDTGRGILTGRIFNVDTSSFSVGDVIYVAVGGGFANVAPSGEANLIQNLGVVTDVDVNGQGEVFGAGRSAATPNLNDGKFFLGNASNKAATAVFSDEANTAIGAYTGNFSASNVSLTKFNETVVSLGTLSGDIAANLDVSTGTIFQVTTGGGLTINSLTNAVAGTSATIIITQGATTGTLTSSMKFAGASKTLSTVTGDIDIISVFYDGSTYYATLSTGYA